MCDVQKTLTDRLAAETPKDPLDLRNRLDSQVSISLRHLRV